MPLLDDNDNSEFAQEFRKRSAQRDALHAKVRAQRAKIPPVISGKSIFALPDRPGRFFRPQCQNPC